MLARILLRILSVSPNGRTTRQFVRSLEQASVKTSRAEVLAALDQMRRQRLITIDRVGHWTLRNLQAEPPATGDLEQDGCLGAIRLRISSVSEPTDFDGFDDTMDAAGPPMDRLLSYYCATQKWDGRGPVSQSAGQHANQFQVFNANGQWWSPSSMLSINLDVLPPTFRYALSRRKGDAVIIGYPLAVIIKDGLCRIVPVGMINASISRSGYVLQITPQSDRIVLNPEWVQQAKRGAGFDEARLAEQFDGAEGLCFDAFRDRLSDCKAAQLSDRLVPDDLLGSLDPGSTGIRNAAALFLPDEMSFTNGAAADLGQLAKTPSLQLRGTALWTVLHSDTAFEPAETVLNPVPLTPNQVEAAEIALTGPVTAITAPPGTGKTRVIGSIIASALCAEKTVLFVSRTQRAIDAIEEQFAELLPAQPIMVRSNGFEGDRETDFLRSIADPAINDSRASEAIGDSFGRLRNKAALRSRTLDDRATAQRLSAALSEHIERRDRILTQFKQRPQRSNGVLRRLSGIIPGRRNTRSTEVLAPGATLDELNLAIGQDQRALARLAATKDPFHLDVAAGMSRLLPALVSNVFANSAERLRKIEAEQADHGLSGRKNVRRKIAKSARQVLAVRPFWAATAISAPSRLPLVPGIFDYVIFDEANQCDIASALPLMARAKRIVVIGDHRQIQAVPSIGPAQECHMMKEAGLPSRTMAKYAQSRNSLFGFVSGRPVTRPVMLRDQLRTAPAIVDYLNDVAYDGKLSASGEVDDLTVPAGETPGISWTDVCGRVSLNQSGQPQNYQEAKAIVAHLKMMICDRGYAGSIGVVSPFHAQIALLQRLVDTEIAPELQQRARLTITTSDRIRDGMRDVILLSPVVGAGLDEDTRALLMGDRRLVDAPISQAVAVAHIFGDRSFAQQCGIRNLAHLADRATRQPAWENPDHSLQSEWNHKVEAALRARGLNPTLQYPVAGRSLGFALFGKGEIKLNLELDGQQWHRDADSIRRTGDILRDHQMKRRGWRVRRFWLHELEQDMEGCLDRVEQDLAG